MAKYRYPGASGKESFSDNLVGHQITDGSSLMTNTNFEVPKTIPVKEKRNFKSEKFSDFFTLDDLGEQGVDKNSDTVNTTKNGLKFNSGGNSTPSLFGSLKERIAASITHIIETFPAGFYINYQNINRNTTFTITNIVYNGETDITTFQFSLSTVTNPFEIELIDSNIEGRNFRKDFRRYSLIYGDKSYGIIHYEFKEDINSIVLKCKGEPFYGSNIKESVLIRPCDRELENYYSSLDELESALIRRDTTPKYTSSYTVPSEDDSGKLGVSSEDITWPVAIDNYHPVIKGVEFYTFLEDLTTIADNIDTYKSNLFVRFMSAPQLYEFDTPDRKIEAVFQIYGQHFDNIKKHIDHIGYMRNVSYDGINNIPDTLLKNVLGNLGLTYGEFVPRENLTDYERQIVGNNRELSAEDVETAFNRRLLVNLPHLFKSKGTIRPIEFVMNSIGVPLQMVKIQEEVYEVTSVPNLKNLEDKIYDLIEGTYTEKKIRFDNSRNVFIVETDKERKINFNREGYPVKYNSLRPKAGFSKKDDIFFQKGAGWFKRTLDHKSTDIRVEGLVELNSVGDVSKFQEREFTYGEDYFNIYRNLPGLNVGFNIEPKVDNKKITTEPSDVVINRKFLTVFIATIYMMEYELYRKNVQFNNVTLTFEQFIADSLSRWLTPSSRFDKTYGTNQVYEQYKTDSRINHYTLSRLHQYVETVGTQWMDIVAQFVPATTAWQGGVLIGNGELTRNKFQYKYGNGSTKLICDFKYATFTFNEYCYFTDGYVETEERDCTFHNGYIRTGDKDCRFGGWTVVTNDKECRFDNVNVTNSKTEEEIVFTFGQNGPNNRQIIEECEHLILTDVTVTENMLTFLWDYNGEYYDNIELQYSEDEENYITLKTLNGSPVTSTFNTIEVGTEWNNSAKHFRIIGYNDNTALCISSIITKQYD